MSSNIITVTENVTDEEINDLFVTALEGGINYWAHAESYKPDETRAVIFELDENGYPDTNLLVIDKQIILKGLQDWANEVASKGMDFSFREFIENHDAADADLIVQFGLFGELRYS